MRLATKIFATLTLGIVAAAAFATPSSAASMVEYAKHPAPNASMVEYAVHVSPDASMVEYAEL